MTAKLKDLETRLASLEREVRELRTKLEGDPIPQPVAAGTSPEVAAAAESLASAAAAGNGSSAAASA